MYYNNEPKWNLFENFVLSIQRTQYHFSRFYADVHINRTFIFHRFIGHLTFIEQQYQLLCALCACVRPKPSRHGDSSYSLVSSAASPWPAPTLLCATIIIAIIISIEPSLFIGKWHACGWKTSRTPCTAVLSPTDIARDELMKGTLLSNEPLSVWRACTAATTIFGWMIISESRSAPASVSLLCAASDGYSILYPWIPRRHRHHDHEHETSYYCTLRIIIHCSARGVRWWRCGERKKTRLT